MTSKFIKVATLFTFIAATSTFAIAKEQIKIGYEDTNKASFIEMTAAKNQKESFASFLTGAAVLVKKTEPGTDLWFALQGAGDNLTIFDIFLNESARTAHFEGKVAAALKANAPRLVQGGWEKGVVANIENSAVLSKNMPTNIYSATTATYIKLKAAPGQSKALAALLTAGGKIVTDTEPKTLFWSALQLDDNNFAIFDIFADDSGRDAHFAGKVAKLLKEKSATIVAGGWEDGVVSNISNYKIIGIK